VGLYELLVVLLGLLIFWLGVEYGKKLGDD